jgi:pyrroline-5-carboxylate reductase
MTNQNLAILGGGNMGRALIGGLLRRGTRPEHLTVGETSQTARDSLSADFGVQGTPDNVAAIESASVVVVAVKPQVAGAVLVPLQPSLQRTRPLVISIVAGIRLAALEGWCGGGVPVLRAMPNRPALVGAGATALFAPAGASSTHREVAERVMQAVGQVVWVPREDDLDVVTALSGSGPAYFFLLAELLMHSAIDLGLEPSTARQLAIATLHGAGQLANCGDGDLARMRAEVTSKGGTTEAALNQFAAADLRATVARAVEAAARRGREMADQFGASSGNP